PPLYPAPKYIPPRAPPDLALLWETPEQVGRLPLDIGKNLTAIVGQARDPRSDVRARLRAVRDLLRSGLGASNTPINQPVGPHRRFDWLAMSLEQIKVVKNRLGGTVNDVVLATVAGALRRFLERRQVNCELIDFRVMAPVSVRSPDESGTLGNRVSAWIVPMPLGERNARRRLEMIRETTAHLKETKQALGPQVP